MTDEERKAYGRGYWAGRRDNWPSHKPPSPPDAVVRKLMEALSGLRDELDGLLATFDPEDELEKKFGPKIEAADEAMRAVTLWLFERSS